MKKLLVLVLAVLLLGSITACGDDKNQSNDGDENEIAASQNMDFPKIEELKYSFINGEHYGEPRAVLKLTNNSKYTITQIDFDFSIDQNATDFTAYENLEYDEID